MGADPAERVTRQINGSPWWVTPLPFGFGTQVLERWLHRRAMADPTALTSVDERDRICGSVWPGQAKQAHFNALVLPRAAQLYRRSAANRRQQATNAAVATLLIRKGEWGLFDLATVLLCALLV